MLTILWDNDGVLVDTEGLYFQATRDVLRSVGIPLTADQFKEVSLRRGESCFILAAERGISDGEIARLRIERDRLHAELLGSQSPAIDGAEEVLRSLHGQVRMGVVTSARRVHFEAAHASTDLRRYLDFELTREDYQQSKPHPEPYLTALGRYRLRPEDCIVVEDSERGLAAATAAGLRCLVVLNHWSREGDFSNAARVLPSIRDVPTAVFEVGHVDRRERTVLRRLPQQASRRDNGISASSGIDRP
jgi:HAD superfamily hydrolase (TIGR01509 family)